MAEEPGWKIDVDVKTGFSSQQILGWWFFWNNLKKGFNIWSQKHPRRTQVLTEQETISPHCLATSTFHF